MESPIVREVELHLRELATLASRVETEMAGEVAEIAELVLHALDAGRKLLFCGNGGSAADAQHLATEYVVRFRRERAPLPALALTTDTSLLTAASNDFGFEHVFARQVTALASPGDILFLHSTSGESPNLIEAAKAARTAGVKTIALLARGGGRLKDLVDVALVLPTDNGAHAQELHLAIGHVVCEIVESRWAGKAVGDY
ncbi:MAG: SIS domain-containing protein [Gemmatimonadetes bacterium]|nr:SIS domain-containing protein [Gemmatimonadota bacterium]